MLSLQLHFDNKIYMFKFSTKNIQNQLFNILRYTKHIHTSDMISLIQCIFKFGEKAWHIMIQLPCWMYSCCSCGDLTTNNSWPLVNGELLFSVVYVLDPTLDDSDALLAVIGNVDLVSRVGSFSLRIEGVAFCLAGTAAVIPKR
jgi:hypothetical protein